MKKMKRILCLLLTLVMCLSMVDLSAFAVDTEDVDSESVSETVQEVYTCGKEEHAHDKTCYEEQLVLRNKDGEEITVSIEAYDFDEPAEEYEGYEPVLVDEQDEDENVESDSEGAEDPDNTEDTVIPEDPENSESPVVPENSESPVVPENPENPVIPENPENPVVPENPENPVTPENPAVEARVESVEVENRMSANVADDMDTVEDEAGVLDPENHTYTIGGKSYLTESVLACAFKDVAEEDLHTHTLECVGAFADLVAGLDEFGPKLEAFQEEYYANLAEDDYDEFGDLTEEAMAAFTEAAAAELGEEFNALVNLYKAIPERFADDPAYTETAGTLTNLAGLLGGDLDSGIQTLANTGGIYCDTIDAGHHLNQLTSGTNRVFERSDGNHTIYLTDGYEWKGRLVFGGTGTVTITGNGTINANGKGSAITVNPGCTVILEGNITVKGGSGQYVDHWPQSASYGHTVGGGVCVLSSDTASGTFTMRADANGNAPTITGNTAGAGGGIYVDQDSNEKHPATLNIWAGKINSNQATGVQRKEKAKGGMDCGGGGIWVNGKATIDPTHANGGNIEIKSNSSATLMDLGGGGIYVNNPGSLSLKNAIITGNHADGLGGGVASCVHGKVGIVNIDNNGAAIYSNTAAGVAVDNNTANVGHNDDCTYTDGECNVHWTNTVGDFVDAHSKWQNNTNFKKAAQDIFCAGNAKAGNSGTVISDTRPVDSSAGWTGYAKDVAEGNNFRQITKANNGYIYGGFLLGLTAGNKTETTLTRTVTISGNTSATHGGGVATNGILTMGYVHTQQPKEVHTYSLDGAVPLDVSKTLTGADIAKNHFTFEVVDRSGKVLDTATTDNSGHLTLDYGAGIDQTKAIASSYTFYVREKANTNTVANNTTYRITVNTRLVKTVDHTVAGVTVHEHLYEVNSVTYEQGTGVGTNFQKVSNANSISYTNTWKTDGSLTISKALVSPTLAKASEQFTFEIRFADNTGNGITLPNGNYSDVQFTNGVAIVTLTVTEDGKAPASKTITGLPVGLSYTVTETSMPDGYVAQNGDITKTGTIVSGNNSVTITNEHKLKEVAVTKTVVVEANSKTAPTTKNFTIKVQIGDGSTEHTVSAGNNAWQGPGVYVFNAEVQGTKGENGAATTASATAKITGVPSNVAVGQAVEEALTGADKKFWKTTVNGTTVINSYYEPDNTDITVQKAFPEGTPEGYKPTSVKVELLRNGTKVNEATLDKGNSWKAEWKDLLKYDETTNHTAYTYSVKEVSVTYPNPVTGEDGKTTGLKADDRAEGSNIIRVRNTANKTPEGVAEIVGGWLINEPAEPVNGVFTVTNTWLGNEELGDVDFTVKKTDSLNDVPIQGVTFTLTKKDASGKPDTANKSREVVTGEDGVAKFEALTDGTYTLTETVAPAAYQTVKDKVMDAEGNETEVDANVGRTWELKIVKGTLKSVEEVDGDNGIAGKNTWNWKVQHNGNDVEGVMTITNRPLLGSLTITKDFHGLDKYFNAKDFEGKEFKFVVKNADGSDATHVVEKDGKLEAEAIGEVTVKYDTEAQKWETVTITGLRYGEYTISEVIPEVPDNYTWEGVKFVEVKESTEPTEPEQPDEPTEPTEPEQPSEPDAQADDPAPTESGSQGSVPATPVNPMDSMHQIPLTPATPTYSKDASITVKVEKNEQQVDVKAINVYKHEVASLTIDKTAVSKTPLLMGEQFIFEVTLTEEVAGTIKEDSITFPTGDGKTITFTKQDDAWKAIVTITLDESDNTTEADGVITYEAGSVTIKDIPAGLTYDVHETSRDKWIVAGEESGTLTGDTTVAITNTRATGSLTISKLVKGLNEADFKDKVFTFTVRGPADVDGTYGEGEDAVTFVDREVTVTVTGAGSITIEGLPTGEYTVKENEAAAQVSGYNLSVSVISPVNVENGKESTSTVTNTYSEIPRSDSTSLTVTKAWQGDGSIERPASVTVQLLRDGEPYGDVVTLKASDKRSENWRHTWTGLSRSYTWSVDEVDVPQGYSKDVKKSGTTYTITNTYTPETDIPDDPTPQSGILSVNKVWAGDAGANRPDSVTVQIFKDGTLAETVTLNSANGWSYSKVLSEEEQKSIWSVGEVNVPEGYKSTVSSNGTSFTVTNTYGDTDIPDEEKPTTDIPDEQPPLVDWPDEWPPLVSWPEEPIPVTDIPLTDIPDDDVPLANVPQTGDISLVWYVVAAASAMGLAVLTLKKRKDEED